MTLAKCKYAITRFGECAAVLLAVATLPIASSSLSISRLGDLYLWRRHFKSGDIVLASQTITVYLKANGETNTAKSQVDLSERVTGVSTSGVVAGEQTILKETNTATGYDASTSPAATYKRAPLKYTFSTLGYSFTKESEPGAGEDWLLDALNVLAMRAPEPEIAVRIGDSWKQVLVNQNSKSPTATNPIQVTAKILKIIKGTGGRDRLLIEISATANNAALSTRSRILASTSSGETVPRTIRGRYEIDPSTGEIFVVELQVDEYNIENKTLSNPTMGITLNREYQITAAGK